MLHFIRIGRTGGEVDAVPAPARPGSRRRVRSPHIEVLETRLAPSLVPTMIQISSSASTCIYRDTVSFTAVVTSGQGTPTGSVAFYKYGSPFYPNGLLISNQPVNGQGHASCSTEFSALFRGSDPGKSYDVSAVYLPDPSSDFAGSVTAKRAGVTCYPVPLHILGVVAENKVYDGTTVAHLDLSRAAFFPNPTSSQYIGDTVYLVTTGAVATFASKDVSTGVPVTVSGLSITGGDAPNYYLVPPTGLTADITPPALAGTWSTNGNQTAQVQQNGSSLTFTNPFGSVSPGYFVNPEEPTQVVATAWGDLVGTLVTTADGMQIDWANGARWDQRRPLDPLPQLAGQGFVNGNQGVRITQSGTSLTFTNEKGETSAGYLADATHVVATGWGDLVGTVSATLDGFRISWANGAAWDFLRLTGFWSTSVYEAQPAQVVQPGNGTALTFIDQGGAKSAGYIRDSSHVVATDWGKVGTLAATSDGAVQITWPGLPVWTEITLIHGGEGYPKHTPFTPAYPPPTPTSTPPPTPTATFLRQDARTQGNWIGTYGAQGAFIAFGASPPYGPGWWPSYATITPVGPPGAVRWSNSTTDPRALVTTWDTTKGLSRGLAAGWASSGSFAMDVNLRDDQVHGLELYLLDWDNRGRAEQVQISDATTGAVLSTQSVSSFQSGLYLDYAVSGHVKITFTRQAGPNAVLMGLFLDPVPVSTTATFVEQDTTTQGTWMGTYGSQGYEVIKGSTSLPGYATVTPSGQSTWTWAGSTTDARALQTSGGASRIAACWYSALSFTVDVNLTDGQRHDLGLYFLDWDKLGRAEQVQISDATTGAVLSTQSISSFNAGVYLDYAVSGHIKITFTRTAGQNAVLSGLFLDSNPTA